MITTTTMIYDDYDDEAIEFFLAITMMYDDNGYDLDDDDD